MILGLNQWYTQPRHFAVKGQDLPATDSGEFADQHIWKIEIAGWVRVEGVRYSQCVNHLEVLVAQSGLEFLSRYERTTLIRFTFENVQRFANVSGMDENRRCGGV